MKDEYDFSRAKRGALIQQKNKSRITIYIDNVVLDAFRERADQQGRGYQTMMNEALREYINKPPMQLTGDSFRIILREELTKERQESILRSPVSFTSSDSSISSYPAIENQARGSYQKMPLIKGH